MSVDKKRIDNLGQIVERLKRQLAGFISAHRMDLFDAVGDPMTTSEMRLFGGPRDFKRNILKKIKAKEIK